MIHVTEHACVRFVERCQPCSLAEARAAILSHSRAIQKAIDFNCEVVRLGTGERLVLQGENVVTIYGRGDFPRQCRRSPLLSEDQPL